MVLLLFETCIINSLISCTTSVAFIVSAQDVLYQGMQALKSYGSATLNAGLTSSVCHEVGRGCRQPQQPLCFPEGSSVKTHHSHLSKFKADH